MTWIREYLAYRAGSESPSSFTLFSGLTALGAAMGRKVWLETGDADSRIYPNLYTLLVAPPGLARKSASIMPLRTMLESAQTPVLPYAVGREQLVRVARDSLRKVGDCNHSSLILCSGEFSAMLESSHRRQGTLALLNEWFDCPSRYSDPLPKLSGIIVYGVFLSILAATTPASLSKLFTRADLQSGLASRMLVVVESDEQLRRAWKGKELEHAAQLHKRLSAYLYHVENGPSYAMRLTREAQEAYQEWYEGDDYSASIALPVMRSYLARRQAHVLKLAMIIEYSSAYTSDPQPKRVSVSSFRGALKLIRSLEPRMPLAFGPRSQWANDFTKQGMLEHIAKHKSGVSLDDLRRAYNAAAQSWAVDKAVADLVLLGQLTEGKDGRLRATGRTIARTKANA